MKTHFNQLKNRVIDILTEYSRFSDLSIVYPDFLSIYTLICLTNDGLLDDFDKSKVSELLNNKYEGIDLKLNDLYGYIENRYTELNGVFSRIDTSSYSSKYAQDRSNRIYNLLVELSHLDVSVYDGTCGKIYNELLDYISKSSGKKAADFYTPMSVRKLLIEVISPEENKTIYDPVCGAGGFLIQANDYIKSRGGYSEGSYFYGQEINSSTWQIAKQNLLVNNLFNSCIHLGNTLVNPENMNPDGQMKKFDYVIANPPFSLKKWDAGHDFSNDLRFKYGIPPRNSADFAFVLHCLSSIKENGKAVIVVSPGSLFRMGVEGKIRQRLIEENVIETIIALPSNLFHGTSIAPNILILNKAKESEDIAFIDASGHYREQTHLNTLEEDHISLILSLYKERRNLKDFCEVVSKEQILVKENGVLSVSSYVKKDHFHKVEESFSDLQAKQVSLTNRLTQLEEEMLKLIKS